MNDGVYLCMLLLLGFDLMSQKLQCGDCSWCDDDCYLFFEVLMFVEQMLYISYIGCLIQDNSECFFLVLVQELVDYIGQSYCFVGDEEFDCDVSEVWVKVYIIYLYMCMLFDVVNFQEDENKSYVCEWLVVVGQQGEVYSDFIQLFIVLLIDSLLFDQFLCFWQYLVCVFFQQCLWVNFCVEEDDILDDELFIFEGLSCY